VAIMTDRRAARQLASRAVAEGAPLRWFEQLYAAADDGTATAPWADLAVNPNLASWPRLDPASMRRALVVGCGYGDDAQWLAGRGCEVTAFDISPSAIARCQARFPGSPVHYQAADLLDPPAGWLAEPFDLVVEAYTVQVLPPGSPERATAVRRLAALTGGTLLVIARGRSQDDDAGQMPWPLLRAELDPLLAAGLREVAFDDYTDGDDPPARRFRGTFQRG
jgi:SAM-dependent methyltransferase